MSWAYPVIMLTAVGSAFLISRGRQKSLGLSKADRRAIAFGAFVGMMIGAKLPFAIADWGRFLAGTSWFDNGKTILFGIVGGYLGVEVAKAMRGIRVKTGDSFAVPVAVGVGIGRIACFTASCCYGVPTGLPWGVDFGDGVPRHPTQLYETVFHLTMAVLLEMFLRRGMFRGQLIKLYILAYLSYRFLTEFLRPEPLFALGLTAYQWCCLALIPVFVSLWIRDARMFRREGETDVDRRREVGVSAVTVASE